MLVDWVRLNFGTTVTKSSTSHVGWYPPSTIPHGWWNMMLFWMVKLLWHPVFSDKAVDHWILVTSSWASQPDAANLQELRPQVLRQLRWLVRWGAWKLSENLGTPKISKMWPFLSIFNRENEMENGDDPLELGIACRQTRVCRFFWPLHDWNAWSPTDPELFPSRELGLSGNGDQWDLRWFVWCLKNLQTRSI